VAADLGSPRRNREVSNPVVASSLSRELQEVAERRTPGGVHSNVRLTGARAFIDRAEGAWVWDVDGRDYVDYLLGQGPNFLGHAPSKIVEAVAGSVRGGLLYGGQHRAEIEASDAVCRALGWADMVRFGVSGTESVQGALRLARAATGRDRIVRFEGHYHGWLDNVLVARREGGWGPASAGQLASHLDDFEILPWNDADALDQVLTEKRGEIAAVIMEPIMINAGVIEPRPGYLERVRELCDQHAVVLIFDEVIAGFRVSLGGAAERYGVTPDLATYGKALAGGWPVSAIAGKADLMRLLGTGEVNHSGTFNSSVMATAAVKATLSELTNNPPYERIARHGESLMTGLREIADFHGAEMRVEGLPVAFHVSFGSGDVYDYASLQGLGLAEYESFSRLLVKHGLWVTGRGVWYVSGAHAEAELDETLKRFDAALSEWSTGA
jgi:glutamate-1-semialdehyde 2,1-aminomutase